MANLIAIFLGGGFGSVMRYLIKILCEKNFGWAFPWGTFSVNIIGSLFLGFMFSLVLAKSDLLNTPTKMFLMIGFAGGFTTFSTFSLESVNMIKEGNIALSLIYILSSIILGVLAIYAGSFLAKYV